MNNIFYWLNITEYILIIISFVTLIINLKAGNLTAPLFWLILTVLLNLINRLNTEKRQKIKLNSGLKKLSKQIELIQSKVQDKEIIVPPPPLEGSSSPQIIAEYQEYLASLEKSLTNVVNYLNNSALVPRMEYLESLTSQLTREINNFNMINSSENNINSSENKPFLDLQNKSIPPRQKWSCLNTFSEHKEAVNSLSFTPDGKYLASGSADKSFKIWSVKNSKLINTKNSHEQGLLSLVFTNSLFGNSLHYYLATGSYDQTINLWTFDQDHKLKNSHTLTNHTGSVHSLAIAPQKNLLISGSYDQTIKQWDLETGKLICSSFDPLGAIYAVAINQQKSLIASAGADGSISLWSMEKGSRLGFLSGNVSSVQALAISPNGQTLAAACVDGNIRIWYLTEDIFQNKIEPLPNFVIKAHSGQVTSLIFAPDGENLFSSGADGQVKIWHLPTLSNVGLITANDTPDRHHNSILALALSPDGELLAIGHFEGQISIWLRDN